MLMIKMQLEDYMFLEVHSNLLHISFQKEKLEIEIVHALLYGYTNTIGLNVVSRRIQDNMLFLTCIPKYLMNFYFHLSNRKMNYTVLYVKILTRHTLY